MSGETTLSVGEVSLLIKQAIETCPPLERCRVRGEVSNCTRASSGHLYFSLKEANASLSCAMWRSSASRLDFEPRNGEQVVASGKIEVYPPSGKYQLICSKLERAGAGDLWQQYEELRKRLEAEGLFDLDRKRRLPQFPSLVAVISSRTGAATQDMLTILARRYPPARVVLIPAIVQGEAAAPSLVAALARAARVGADVILFGRGGGSMEDLWCFNDEAVVRAVAASPVPIVSAVGHETDTTLSDFAADLRAATPSAAAELAVPDAADLRRRVSATAERLAGALRARAERARLRLEALSARPALARPAESLRQREQRIDLAWEASLRTARQGLERRGARVASLAAQLEALGPLATLRRGYAVCAREDGGVVRSVDEVAVGETLRVLLPDGRLRARVEGKE